MTSITSLTRSGAISFEPQLAHVVFWIAVACCAVAQAAIVRAALRPPAGVERPAGSAAVPRPSRASELAWTLIPAAMLAAVLALTWRALGR